MNNIEAEKLARSYLCEKVELVCTEALGDLALYGLDVNIEVLFRFRLLGGLSVGSSGYVAVSRATGKVRYMGHCGE